MSRKNRSPVELFGLSFLDCICCGFGAVILIFVITTGRGKKTNEDFINTSSAKIKSLEQLLLQVENESEQVEAALENAKLIKEDSIESMNSYHALKASISKKEYALRNLKAETRSIALASQIQLKSVNKQKPMKQVQPQYLTDFSLEGKRILLLVEASGSMLGRSVNEAMVTLKKSKEERINSPKWKRVKTAVQTLLAYLPEDAKYQVCLFNSSTHLLYKSNRNIPWLDVSDPNARANILTALNEFVPSDGANHELAFLYADELDADNVVLLTDGLPTLAYSMQVGGAINEFQRINMMNAAMNVFPQNASINILLFPMKGDPGAAPYYWRFSYIQNGALITPSRNWPTVTTAKR